MSELEPEVEIDLGRTGLTLLRGWWLVVASGVLGAVIGLLFASGGSELFQARTTVYLGQPLASNGTSRLETLQTNPLTAGEIVRGQELMRTVADQVGIRPAALRRNTSTRTVSGFTTRGGQAPLIEISVRGTDPDNVTEAANLLAEAVVVEISKYANAKIAILKAVIVEQESELSDIERQQDEIDSSMASEDSTDVERALIAIGSQSVNARRAALIEDLAKKQLDVMVAEEVERARVLNVASAKKVDARSSRSSIVVGAIVGGIVGIVLALLAPGIRRRFARQPATG